MAQREKDNPVGSFSGWSAAFVHPIDDVFLRDRKKKMFWEFS